MKRPANPMEPARRRRGLHEASPGVSHAWKHNCERPGAGAAVNAPGRTARRHQRAGGEIASDLLRAPALLDCTRTVHGACVRVPTAAAARAAPPAQRSPGRAGRRRHAMSLPATRPGVTPDCIGAICQAVSQGRVASAHYTTVLPGAGRMRGARGARIGCARARARRGAPRIGPPPTTQVPCRAACARGGTGMMRQRAFLSVRREQRGERGGSHVSSQDGGGRRGAGPAPPAVWCRLLRGARARSSRCARACPWSS